MHPRIQYLSLFSRMLDSLDSLAFLFLATTFSRIFFPFASTTTGITYSLALFGISRILRHFGSFLMDYYPSLLQFRNDHPIKLSVLATLPTVCIGLLPTYGIIGNIATGLLIGLVLLHSLTKPLWIPAFSRPFLFQSITNTTTIPLDMIGSLLGGLFFLYYTPDNIQAWGWRLPFLLQMPLAFGVALFKHDPVTLFTASPFDTTTLSITLATQKKRLWLGGIVTSGLIGSAYTLSLYLPFYLTTHLHYDTHTILLLNALSLAGLTLVGKIISYIDLNHFTKGFSLTLTGVILSLVGTYPVFTMLQNTTWLYLAFALFSLHFVTHFIFATHSMLHALFFKNATMYLMSIIISYLPAICLASLTPFICHYGIEKTGLDLFPAYYNIGLNLLTLIALCYYPKAADNVDSIDSPQD